MIQKNPEKITVPIISITKITKLEVLAVYLLLYNFWKFFFILKLSIRENKTTIL